MRGIDPQHRKWVESFAHRAHRRLVSAGCRTLLLEDVRQECWLAFTKARAGYDPERGAAFGTYLFRAMAQEVNRWAEGQIGFAHATALGDDAIGAAEATPSDRLDPEEAYASRARRGEILAAMTPVTRQVVEFLDEPPAWLMDEFKASRAKVAWCRSRGFAAHAARDLSLGLIYAVMGLTRAQQGAVSAEIRVFASAQG